MKLNIDCGLFMLPNAIKTFSSALYKTKITVGSCQILMSENYQLFLSLHFYSWFSKSAVTNINQLLTVGKCCLPMFSEFLLIAYFCTYIFSNDWDFSCVKIGTLVEKKRKKFKVFCFGIQNECKRTAEMVHYESSLPVNYRKCVC